MMFTRKNILLIFLFFNVSLNCLAQTEFITTWETTTSSESITIPTTDGGYNYDVDWGDGNSDTSLTGDATHTYATANTYTVTITGTFNRIYFNATGDKDKIQSIEQWGTGQVWTSMQRAFDGCANLVNNATDVPDFSGLTNVQRMFRDATSIGNGSATNWNSWDLSTVTNIAQMFRSCPNFNEDISNWVVSAATNMNNLFRDASSFNQDISNWNTGAALSMNNLFRDASSFNQDISNWNTGAALSMNNMFLGATSFDQNIGGWDIADVTTMNNIFNSVTFSVNNYNALLIGWEPQIPAGLTGVTINLGTSKYCSPAAIAAKANIITNRSWTFNDGGVLASFTWTGATDTEWNESTNWQDGYDSACEIDISIPASSNDPIINTTSNITADNLTIDSGATLTIDGSLTVDANLTITGELDLNSASSLIVNGSSTGNLTYTRDLIYGEVYQNVSAPVQGETIENYISTNPLDTGNGNVGLYYYDNNTTSGFAGTGYIFYQPTSTGSFVSGKGYGTRFPGPAGVQFTGTMPTADVSISISKRTVDATEDRANLIGNPFPSYLASNDNTGSTENLLTQNTSVLNEETLWFWNPFTYDYVAINNGSPAHYVPPAQGFFVDSNDAGGTFNFEELWQSHQTTETFYRNADTTFRIELSVSNENNQKKSTQIFYIPNKTVMFDNGYDSTSISDINEVLYIGSKIVGNLNGQNLAIQTLPSENLQNYVIPLSVKGIGNLTFNTTITNKPADIKIILEDRFLNTFTLLDTEINHQVNVGNLSLETNRFYLHTENNALSLEEENLNTISIYTSKNKVLNIAGLSSKKTKYTIYDILGKELKSEVFLAENSTKSIPLTHLKTGLYIIKLETENGVLSKKVILE